jgi:hypothetical protein
MRQRSRLISINFAFPGSNQSDESIETFMTTSLEPLGCESHSENISTKWIPVSQNSSNRQIVLKGSREPSTLWHVRCLLDGKITTQSHVKLRFTINGQAVTRESFSLGEYLHPVRGFLWHSPDSLELTGAQILDATSALSVPTLSGSAHSKVNIWTDRFPTSTHLSQPTYVFKNGSGVVSPETTENQDNQNKFSERK